MFDLSGKKALVTGASGGLGGAIVRALASQGATVALSGTRAEALEAVQRDVGASHPVLPCNLSDETAVDGLIGRAEEALGGLDVLVSNAGVTKDGLLMRMKDEDWSFVQKVNLEAYFRLTRAALRGMMKRRHGRIIAITSVVGVTGNPGQTNYAASKAGVIGFTKALAAELAAKGVTVNAICPGYVATPMVMAIKPEILQGIIDTVPMKRLAKPEEIGGACAYLASDIAGFMTGSTMNICGGLYYQ